MVDFGCGYGYLGLILMPLLPLGSTYTGIDRSETLLAEAEKMCDSFAAAFIHADLREYVPGEKYDVAVTNAVLRHIPGPKVILDKMIRSVRPGGWVICMETDRLMEDAGRYFSNLDYTALGQTELYKKIWRYERENGGRDFRTGVKIPQYMGELGLTDVQVRISDAVRFANPQDADYEHVYQSMAAANGWDRIYTIEEKRKYTETMLQKGLAPKDAEKFVNNEMRIQRSVQAGHGTEYVMEMACTPISFGRKQNNNAPAGISLKMR